MMDSIIEHTHGTPPPIICMLLLTDGLEKLKVTAKQGVECFDSSLTLEASLTSS
jgi:hypothetical protein